ncbi:glycosyltransferase family 1 protein [Alkalihalobacillus deserti]|uniref:glycosyltransferase family 1 protein n=1 Tax=Alkalihalobacillus deserti TaxID=2879466 RepID=UPI001D14635F|nr:glycosyltransferase family 1 protein [Alkalihalobacillus deserti]
MNRGGLETMLMNYYRQMDRTKIQFDFMVHREESGHYDEEILNLGGNIYKMPQIRPGNYKKYFKLLDDFFLLHSEYRVVHSHINENSSFVIRAANKAGVPCRIAHSHLSDLGLDLKLPFRIYARNVMKDHPTEYFACSQKAGEWLFGKQLANSEKVTVLNNAVDVNQFKFNQVVRNQIRKEINAGEKLVIGHIGRFNKQKNHEFLLDIFKSLHKKNPNSLLVLVGDGHLRATIEKKAKQLDLSPHVRFLGVRENISELMQGFDLFLFPSLFEGLPVVLVEAQAAGLSCIISDSITKESNVTGRIDFCSLKEQANVWADKILTSSYDHKDTSKILREKGYDTATMADWLYDFYMNRALALRKQA